MNKKKLNLSIITASYNCKDDLSKTLNAVKSLKDNGYLFEYIVIDGASTDGCMELAQANSAIIDIFLSKKDSGISEAWNRGLELVTKSYVMFLNSGDEIGTQFLTSLSPCIETIKGKTVFYGATYMRNDNGEVVSKIDKTMPEPPVFGFGFMHTSTVSSIDLFDSFGGFDTSYKIAIDTEWLIKVYKNNARFIKFDGYNFMDMGGVSDIKYIDAQNEFLKALIQYGLISKRGLFLHRVTYRLYDLVERRLKVLSFFSRLKVEFKVFLLFLLNLFLKFNPVIPVNKLVIRAIGGSVGKDSVIHRGVKIFSSKPIEIGSGTIINNGCYLDNRGGITIGDNVSMAHECRIYTAGHDINCPYFSGVNKKVSVGDNVVLFAGVKIMPGVKIGSGSIVLPFSVVTKDVPDNAIVGGVPASVKGNRSIHASYKLFYPYWFGN